MQHRSNVRQYVFREVHTYQDLVNLIVDCEDYLINSCLNQEVLPKGYEALESLNHDQQERLLSFAENLDKMMNLTTAKRKNLNHKIPTLLVAAIYIYCYPNKVEDYTEDELAVLSKFSITEEFSFYEQVLSFYTKDFLEKIIRKSDNYIIAEEFMLLSHLLRKDGKEKDEIEQIIDDYSPEL